MEENKIEPDTDRKHETVPEPEKDGTDTSYMDSDVIVLDLLFPPYEGDMGAKRSQMKKNIGKMDELSGEISELYHRLLTAPEQLDENEILIVMVALSTAHEDSVLIAKTLLHIHGTLLNLLQYEPAVEDTIVRRGGMLNYLLKLIYASMYHLTEKRARGLPSLPLCEDVIKYLLPALRLHRASTMNIVYLDNDKRLIKYEILVTGSLEQMNIYPREIIRRVLSVSAAEVFMIRYQPTGVIKCRSEEFAVARRLRELLNRFDVRLIDYLLVDRSQYVGLLGPSDSTRP
jgi:DNA repair protein RadC